MVLKDKIWLIQEGDTVCNACGLYHKLHGVSCSAMPGRTDQFGFVGFSRVTGWTAGGARPGVINLGLRRSKSPLTMAPNPDGASGQE